MHVAGRVPTGVTKCATELLDAVEVERKISAWGIEVAGTLDLRRQSDCVVVTLGMRIETAFAISLLRFA